MVEPYIADKFIAKNSLEVLGNKLCAELSLLPQYKQQLLAAKAELDKLSKLKRTKKIHNTLDEAILHKEIEKQERYYAHTLQHIIELSDEIYRREALLSVTVKAKQENP